MPNNITVAVIGLGFGEDFIPIYMAHPAVRHVVPVDVDPERAAGVARRFGLERWETNVDSVLSDPKIDAIHIVAPVPFHTDLTLRSLKAGKATACAVPMATSIEDLEHIISTQEHVGKTYMMMETSLYGREYFYARKLLSSGELGAPTGYSGFHIQNLDGYPRYWQGYPPMHYITHALSPALGLLDTSASSVRCMGTGSLEESRYEGGFNNPFPAEYALFKLTDSEVVANITMAFFQYARPYVEGFSLYGSRGGLEWPVDNDGPLIKHSMSNAPLGGRGNSVSTISVTPDDDTESLIPELRPFVQPHEFYQASMPAPIEVQAWHSGSHPYLVQEFVASVTEQRRAAIDARRSAELTAPGICAHESALLEKEIRIPKFSIA